MLWFMARTASKRPSLIHKIDTERYGYTVCGLEVTRWSRVYIETPFPEVQCMRCKAGDRK